MSWLFCVKTVKSKLILQKIFKKVVFLICNGFDMRGLLFHRACKMVSFSAFPLFHKSSFRDINETSSSVPVRQQTQARQLRLDMCQNHEKSNLSFSLSICFCTRSTPSFPPSKLILSSFWLDRFDPAPLSNTNTLPHINRAVYGDQVQHEKTKRKGEGRLSVQSGFYMTGKYENKSSIFQWSSVMKLL